MKKHEPTNTMNLDELSRIGLAALLPGMRRMIELMTKAYEEQHEKLARLQDNGTGLTRSGKKLGRPRTTLAKADVGGEAIKSKSGGASWANMTKEERSAEMKRRQQVAETNKRSRAQAAATHPRDPNHPKHAQWVKNLQKSSKAYWDRMSEAQRKGKTATMVAARVKAVKAKKKATQVPTVRQVLEASA